MKKKEKCNSKETIYLIMTVAFGLFIVCGIVYFTYSYLQIRHSQQQYEELLQSVNTAEETSAEDVSEIASSAVVDVSEIPKEADVDFTVYNIPEKNLDFAALREENPDIYAWITIPDTKIDYPILQHPTELDYYLDYNIDGSKGYPGCIYSQFMNAKDFSDFHTVLYGHNMKAGTMFANLHYYEDEEFFRTHPYVYVYTEKGPLVYQVFAAYTFSNIHLLMGFDLTKEEVRQTYIDNILSLEGLNDNFNREVEVTTDSNLLTLCTCISNQADKRYLVTAVLVADGRTE